MNTGRRLIQYTMIYKGIVLTALLMLSISVAAELAGPFIAKQIIDQHVVGIEKPWFQTEQTKDAVYFNGKYYKRSDRFLPGEPKGKEMHILQVKRDFYIINGQLLFEGTRTASNQEVTIQNGNAIQSYSAQKLSANELYSFYKPEITSILLFGVGYLGLIIISALFAYGQKLYMQKAANLIIQKMREDVFAHIQRLPISYFDRLPAGKIVSRVTNDTETIRELYVTVVATFFSSSIYIAGILLALFFLNVKFASACLLIIPILYGWIVLYRKFASQYNHKIRSKLSDINGMINESIQGMAIIQAFRQEKQIKGECKKHNDEYYYYQTKLLSLNSATSHNLVGILRNISFVSVIWYFGGASLTVNNAISLGVLYAFVDYLTRLFAPITGMVNQLANLEQSRVSAERVFQLLDEEGEEVKVEEIPRPKGDVEFQHVSFAYNGKDYVLKDISFQAKQGETIALVGHTGSGKSSIMNILFGFYDYQKGIIKIDGRDISSMSKQALRTHMGIVLQDPFLFTGTIATNVNLENEAITKDMIQRALESVGADRFLAHLQDGLDEPVIEKGSTLSTGERQLISFARALAFNPAILILDEATANIDTETEALIQQALEVLKKGRTTFVIAHRLSTIKNADKILVLERGEIVECGTHEELMEQKGRYHQMYVTQTTQAAVG
ncbi:ABC transporter ATP-binding protein [Ectobacillus polymachus]|uniref:ABC transporter ATP-binding protein n=1 Tax=Ectobacillus polymachus TaxID=1508806 RepID=UPI003A87FEA3